MSQWFLNRLFETTDQATPRFAFQGTINWMRALSIIVNSELFDDKIIDDRYKKVQRRKLNEEYDTITLENIFLAIHQCSSLSCFNAEITQSYDICRSAIISWYYCIYFCSSSMIAAASGSKQETHSLTSKVWNRDIVLNNLVLYPFDLNLQSLVPQKVDFGIKNYRNGNMYDLNDYPVTLEQAHGALISYLKGTANYRKWEVELKVKNQQEFKSLNVDNFRTNKAREIRDKYLDREVINFLVQSFRYRGKADIETLLTIINGNPNNFVYRGHSNKDWNLGSTLERILNNKITNENATKVEEFTLHEFQSKMHIYDNFNKAPSTKLEWLAMMQHYGVPTRLLDFTNSPYIALYFAIETFTPTQTTDMALYALDYRSLIKRSIEIIKKHDKTFKYDCSDILLEQDSIFDEIFDRYSFDLVWITEPKLMNVRIDRQSGSFLLKSNFEESTEDLLDSEYSHVDFYK